MIDGKLPGVGDPDWENRIVGHDVIPASELLANPANYRIHPRFQQEVVADSLNDIGWIDGVTINKNTGVVVNGHLRATLALRKGDDTPVPVDYVDLTEEEEALALAVFDMSTGLAGVDKLKLRELMDKVKTQSKPIMDMLKKHAKTSGVEAGVTDEPEIKISPELYERQDYLVFYFENEFDWLVACEKFGVETVLTAQVGTKTLKQKGMGRVLNGKLLVDGRLDQEEEE